MDGYFFQPLLSFTYFFLFFIFLTLYCHLDLFTSLGDSYVIVITIKTKTGCLLVTFSNSLVVIGITELDVITSGVNYSLNGWIYYLPAFFQRILGTFLELRDKGVRPVHPSFHPFSNTA